MAEIKVEKKNKAPVWPWIIGILILLGLIWLLINAFGDENEEYELEEIDPQEVEGRTGDNFQDRPDLHLLTEANFFKKA